MQAKEVSEFLQSSREFEDSAVEMDGPSAAMVMQVCRNSSTGEELEGQMLTNVPSLFQT